MTTVERVHERRLSYRDAAPADADDTDRPAVVIVGNEKGGTGKSTTTIHLAVGLLYEGYTVGTLDLDLNQGTLGRYFTNRQKFSERFPTLPMPRQRNLAKEMSALHANESDAARYQVRSALEGLRGCDVVILDTPGHQSILSRVGHEAATVLITPINDSLVDIDVLAEIDSDSRTIVAPSFYCRRVWEYHNRRVADGYPPVDWVVIRNRLPHIHSHNQRDVREILDKLSQRIGFRLAPGLGERVVFRELFLKGLTVLDLHMVTPDHTPTMSQRAACDEIRALVAALNMPKKAQREVRQI